LTQFWVSKKGLSVSWPALASWGIAMAAALVLELTGAVHLFFLFVPVWILTAVLYIVFASMGGAREKFASEAEDAPAEDAPAEDAHAEDAPAEETYSNSPESDIEMPKWTEAPKKTDVVLWICAILALGSLATCVILPVWVYRTGFEDYISNFAWFKKALIWPTLIYFVTGTIWAIKRDKAK